MSNETKNYFYKKTLCFYISRTRNKYIIQIIIEISTYRKISIIYIITNSRYLTMLLQNTVLFFEKNMDTGSD